MGSSRGRGRMGLSRARTVTLIVALATLTSNILSSLLFSQLPDDPYHLAANFGWYLHFANVLSVFGFIGALRQHALSIAIFSNYLILDTLLCAIPRFLLLSLLQPLSSTLCAEPSSPQSPSFPSSHTHVNIDFQQPSPPLFTTTTPQWDSLSAYTAGWTEDGCMRVLFLAQITLAAGVVAATLLQFVGALCVREYARALWVWEMREEERVVAGSCDGRWVEEGRGIGSGRLEVIVEVEEEKVVG